MFVAYVDGACAAHTTKCGSIGVRIYNARGEIHTEFSEHSCDTTSNRMEISAVIMAFGLTPREEHLMIKSDSQYVVGTMVKGWKRRFNNDLWATMDEVTKGRRWTIHWQPRNTGPDMKAADALAYNASRRPCNGN